MSDLGRYAYGRKCKKLTIHHKGGGTSRRCHCRDAQGRAHFVKTSRCKTVHRKKG